MCNPRICYKVNCLLYSNINLCMTATVALCKFYFGMQVRASSKEKSHYLPYCSPENNLKFIRELSLPPIQN